jgi:hypothetical protein
VTSSLRLHRARVERSAYFRWTTSPSPPSLASPTSDPAVRYTSTVHGTCTTPVTVLEGKNVSGEAAPTRSSSLEICAVCRRFPTPSPRLRPPVPFPTLTIYSTALPTRSQLHRPSKHLFPDSAALPSHHLPTFCQASEYGSSLQEAKR